jgi:hypothetical protein
VAGGRAWERRLTLIAAFRFPAEVITHAVWLYHCFGPSLREVGLILAERGVAVSHEIIRARGLRFGRAFADMLEERRPRPDDEWHLDEVRAGARASSGGRGSGDATRRRQALPWLTPSRNSPRRPCREGEAWREASGTRLLSRFGVVGPERVSTGAMGG